MKWVPAAAIYLGVVALFAFAFIHNSDAYKEWKDPCGYWRGKLAWRAELLAMYEADAAACLAKKRELEENRDLWIKQKTLEGMTAAEGAKDFEIALWAREAACDFSRSAAKSERDDVREARSKVELMCSR
jgi:hypothetical protein